MLVSMVNNIRPTRAEVSDVYTAVRDGTDAVMLSEETAVGKYPVKAVEMLDRIIHEVEGELELEQKKGNLKSTSKSSVPDAICYAATGAADKIAAKAILACTKSGTTAKLMSKYRPKQKLYGATSIKKVLPRMALMWGVEPVLVNYENVETTEDEILQAMIAVRDKFGVKPGSRVVITAGLRTNTIGATNVLEIREIPRGI